MNIIELFLFQGKEHPEKEAVIFNDKQVSYAELTEYVRLQSACLSSSGIGIGSHLLVVLENSINFLVLMLSAAELGAVVVPLSPSLGGDAVLTAIYATETDYFISTKHKIRTLLKSIVDFPISHENIFSVDGVLSEYSSVNMLELECLANSNYVLGQKIIPIETDYILTMTSGSTSAPKPIVFTQKNKIDRAFLGARDVYNLNSQDVILVGSPMHHSLGQRLALLPLLLGGKSVILSHFTPKKWLESVHTHKITFTIAVSSQLEHIYQASKTLNQYDITSLKCLVSSSALLKEASKQELLRLFSCELHECYGASEVGIVSNLSLTESRHHIKSVGKALPYVKLKILDENNQVLPNGQIGEIACATATLFSRYFNNPKATESSIIEGFFKMGDIGYLDEEGFLYFCDRKKDIIIVGGTNVYSKDVEEALNAHDKVLESAVIGVEDDYFGDVILAVVVKADDSLTELELKQYCLGKLADFQQPLLYEFITELPKNAMGKIAKPVLRSSYKNLANNLVKIRK